MATKAKLRNWRTSVGAILSTIGQGLAHTSANQVVVQIGQILTAVGTLILGLSAVDTTNQ